MSPSQMFLNGPLRLQNKSAFLLPAKMRPFHINKIYGRNMQCEKKKQEAASIAFQSIWILMKTASL